MGIKASIGTGGVFPLSETPRTKRPEEVLGQPPIANHDSFRDYAGENVPPGHQVIQEHVTSGFGLLFADRASAEAYMGGPIVTAPLGTISKQRPDGSMKHRVIMDLRLNHVNDTVSMPERQVLPTAFSHALDMTELAAGLGPNQAVNTLVLDVRDAFMGIPLAAEEMAYNACQLDLSVKRGRPAIIPEEAWTGTFVVWGVLGFGGRPNPLVFARAISFAARSAQALLRTSAKCTQGSAQAAPGRLQMYVDDPTLAVAGSASECELAVDLVLLWWRALGLPLAWSKGVYSSTEHTWIGANFRTVAAPVPHTIVTVPPQFAAALHLSLEPFARDHGSVSQTQVNQTLGRVARLAYIVPPVRPYVAALWAAVCASERARAEGKREAPPGRFASRRFNHAASWLRCLLQPASPDDQGMFPLEQHVVASVPPLGADAPRIHVDASPWGGGAAVQDSSGRFTQFFALTWPQALAEKLEVEIGMPSGQTTWEYLVVLLALILWHPEFPKGVRIFGDNLGALQGALHLRGRAGLSKITRELSWRKARHQWRFSVGHLPTEANLTADALSRLTAPEGSERKLLPASVSAATRRELDVMAVWQCT